MNCLSKICAELPFNELSFDDPVLPDGLDKLPPRKSLFTVILTLLIIDWKCVVRLKMLAIISVMNLDDWQTHIFLQYLVYILAYTRTLGELVSDKYITLIDFGLDHLATL
jgi:hypothetical protein